MTLLLTRSQVMDLLTEQGGMRYREARALLMRLPPHPHGLHSRHRWLQTVVLDCLADLQQGVIPLGKGAQDAVSKTVKSRPHVRPC